MPYCGLQGHLKERVGGVTTRQERGGGDYTLCYSKDMLYIHS